MRVPEFIDDLSDDVREQFRAIFAEDAPGAVRPGAPMLMEELERRQHLTISGGSVTGPASANEGATPGITLKATPEYGKYISGWTVDWGDGSAVQWVSGNGGSYETTVYPSHGFADGTANRTINVKAFETGTYQTEYGASFSSSYTSTLDRQMSMTINNVAPTITLSGNSPTSNETYTLSRSISDPGQDTITQWVIDWGDDTPFQTVAGNPASFTHVYAYSGNFEIEATATDEDNTYLATKLAPILPELPNLYDLTVTGGNIAQGQDISASMTVSVEKVEGGNPTVDTLTVTLIVPAKYRAMVCFGRDEANNPIFERDVIFLDADWSYENITLERLNSSVGPVKLHATGPRCNTVVKTITLG